MMNSDVEEAMLKHYGMSTAKESNLVNKPKICKICELPNSYDSKICSKCGKSLDLKAALEIEEKDKEKQQMLEDRIARQEQATQTILEKLETLQKV